jgi:hypothetical protein
MPAGISFSSGNKKARQSLSEGGPLQKDNLEFFIVLVQDCMLFYPPTCLAIQVNIF